MFESRKVNGPMVITDWIPFPEAGETMESLQTYLDMCFGRPVEIFEEPSWQGEMRWGIAEGVWQGYQFRKI
jgi:hypothetical protein